MPSRWSLLNPNYRQPLNPSRDLLGKMLHQVQLQLEEDLGTSDMDMLPRGSEVDIIFSGGGLRGYYCCGASVLLNTLVERYDLKIRRLAGASAGAWCAVFMACGLHPLDWADTYYESSSRRDSMLLDAYRAFIPTMMEKTLPVDAWQRCSGRVFISITRVSLQRGIENVVVSEFTSNADLIGACLASSTIPLVSTSSLFSRYRGWIALDGGITNNLPTFDNRDEYYDKFLPSQAEDPKRQQQQEQQPRRGRRRQLLFDMRGVAYPFAYTLSANDVCIESLILRGAVEFRLFLLGRTRQKHRHAPVAWGSYDGRERWSFLHVVSSITRGACFCALGAWALNRYARPFAKSLSTTAVHLCALRLKTARPAT